MNKLFVFQIIILIVLSSIIVGMFLFTDGYEKIHQQIVSETCLSCIKLEPIFEYEWNVKDNNPGFVLENLSKGPILLAYRIDVCHKCDEVEPVLMDIFNVTFEKEDVFYKTVEIKDTSVTFIHINKDHSSNILRNSQKKYDNKKIGGVPMFTMISIGYHRGFIKPYYATFYGGLGEDTNSERREIFENVIDESIGMYNEHIHAYEK